MPISVYNSLTRQKEPLATREEGRVGVYVCGVTPYDYTHIGHARVSVVWDVFRRYLRYRGFGVKFVQNFTDVDDKIINKANREGVAAADIAERYIGDYLDVMSRLGVERADVHPRVTTEMDEIVKVIEGLVERGFAYEAGGDVFFDVVKFRDYGKLSRRSLEEMEAGARIEVSQTKRNPMDFALWKSAKPGEPAWPSPWGPGRPGWHIECSAMALKYLDDVDIHGGGLDLIFPHHENEVAQSEAYTGRAPFARYWLHNGLVNVADEKMSKSLGNSFAVRDVLKSWDALTVRYFLIATQYRSPLTYSETELTNAKRARERLVQTISVLRDLWRRMPEEARAGGEAPTEVLEAAAAARQSFIEAMDDDFNTAVAVATLHELSRQANRYFDSINKPGVILDSDVAAGLKALLDVFAELDGVLGVLGLSTVDHIISPGGSTVSSGDASAVVQEEGQAALAEELMDLLLQVRADARTRKDFQTSDRIRDGLKSLGITIEDTPHGARWKREKRD